MKIITNILWLIFGGLLFAILWFLIGIMLCATIIAIPLGVQCFKLATLMFAPFGKEVRYASGTGSVLLNILWIIIFGWELALSFAILGIFWCISILGIPIGLQCFKFAQLALMPFGAEIVDRSKNRYIFSN